MEEKQTDRVIKGALLLTVAGVLSKILSASYRIPLQNLTGDIGFYLYQQIYPIIGIALMMALYGFPSAISIIRAQLELQDVRITIRNFFLPIGFIVFVLCVLFFIPLFVYGYDFARAVGDVRLGGAYQATTSVFLFVPFISLFRGYFQGNNLMKPTAYSQIGEQLVRVSIIIIGAYLCFIGLLELEKISYVAIVAAIGGALVASWIGAWHVRREQLPFGPKESIPWGFYIRMIVMFGLVSSLNHMLLLLLQFVDMVTLIPQLQVYGFDRIEAMEAKGVFDRGQPLIQFGTVLGSSFALALLPALSTTSWKKRAPGHTRSISIAYACSIYIATGATIGLFLLFPQVNALLFTDTQGTGSLRILALSIVLSSTAITIIAILQGAGKMKQTALAIFCACGIKWGLNVLFVPILGITGSALATVCSLLALCLYLWWVIRRLYLSLTMMTWRTWRGLIYATSLMAGYIVGMQWFFSFWHEPSRITLLIYIGFVVCSGTVIYMRGCMRWNLLTKEMIEGLPGSRFLKKMYKW